MEGFPAIVSASPAVAALNEGLDPFGGVGVGVVHPQVKRMALVAGMNDSAGERLVVGIGWRRAMEQGRLALRIL